MYIKIKCKREGNREDHDQRTRKTFWTITESEPEKLRNEKIIKKIEN